MPTNLAINKGLCYSNPCNWQFSGSGEPEPPDVPGSLYYATIPYDIFGSLVMGAFGAGAASSPEALAGSLQSSVIPQSGAAYYNGGSDIIFWILSDTEYLDWTFNGNPITFNLSGDAVALACYETATFPFTGGEPNTSDWYNFAWTIFGNNCETGSSLAYDSGGYATLFPTLLVQLFGVGVTGTLTVTGTTVYIKVFNTYIIPTNIVSQSALADVQNNATNPTTC